MSNARILFFAHIPFMAREF